GHPVKLTTQDETDPTSGQCGKAGGQTAATKLAADSSVAAVIGTSCSSAALGVADTILGNKGVLLVSASATSAKLPNAQFRNPYLKGVDWLGSYGCNESNFYKLGKSAATARYVYLSSPNASPGATSALYTQQQDAYTSQYGKPTASINANAFDAFNIIVKAIKAVAVNQSGTLYIPRTKLRDAMYNVKDYDGLTG